MLDVEVTSYVPDPATGDAEVTFALVSNPDQEFYATYRAEECVLVDADTEEPVTDTRLYRAWVSRIMWEWDASERKYGEHWARYHDSRLG